MSRRAQQHRYALDPGGERPVRNRLDHQADEPETMVGILEARVGLDGRRGLQIGHQLLGVEEGSPIAELTRVLAVSDDPGAVGKHLGQRCAGNPGVEVLDVLPDRVVELELTLLAQLHHAGSGEALGVRCDAKAMPRGKRYAPGQIGVTERLLEDDPVLVRDDDHAARLLRHPHLEIDPARDVVESRLEPFLHWTILV
jgi:hypothetical protein